MSADRPNSTCVRRCWPDVGSSWTKVAHHRGKFDPAGPTSAKFGRPTRRTVHPEVNAAQSVCLASFDYFVSALPKANAEADHASTGFRVVAELAYLCPHVVGGLGTRQSFNLRRSEPQIYNLKASLTNNTTPRRRILQGCGSTRQAHRLANPI